MIVAILVLFLLCIYGLSSKKGRPPLASGAIPILGHALKMITSPEELHKFIMFYSKEGIRRDGPLTIQIVTTDVYFVTSPADASTVLNSCLEKDIVYDYFKPWLGDGLLLATETIWKKHRKLLNPAFNQWVLDSYLPELNKHAKSLVSKLDAKVGKGKFDHAPYFEHMTLQIICSTAMGVSIDDKDIELREQYIRAKSKYTTGLIHRAQTFWLHSDFMYNFSSLKKIQNDLAETLHELTNTIIKKRKDERRQVEYKTEKRLKSFMELLLDMEQEGALAGTEVREEVDTFVFAGSDTLSVTLTITMLVVGTYPDVQRKIVEELREVFQGSTRDVSKLDLLQLKYLEAVVKETLRLFPTIPLVGRTLDKDIKIKNYTLPSGSRCYVCLNGVSRHPSWGADADQFRPERWLEPGATLPAQQFAAFGFGKRRCIGSTFAVMSAKLALAHVFRHYRISGDVAELRLKMAVIARPIARDYISIERRAKTEYVGQK